MKIFVLADLGSNHNGNPEVARHLVELAWAPAQADGVVLDSQSPLSPETLISLRERVSSKLSFFAAVSEPGEITRVAGWAQGWFLRDSAATHRDLIREALLTGKPTIASTILVGPSEIQGWAKFPGAREKLTLLYQGKPLHGKPEVISILPMKELSQFELPVGYSDDLHTWDWALVAAVWGARLIVKRITKDVHQGQDHTRSLEPWEFFHLTSRLRALEESLGEASVANLPSWVGSDLERTLSLVAARPVRAGSVLQPEDVTVKSPLLGVTANLQSFVIGKKVLYDLQPNDPITFGMIDL